MSNNLSVSSSTIESSHTSILGKRPGSEGDRDTERKVLQVISGITTTLAKSARSESWTGQHRETTAEEELRGEANKETIAEEGPKGGAKTNPSATKEGAEDMEVEINTIHPLGGSAKAAGATKAPDEETQIKQRPESREDGEMVED